MGGFTGCLISSVRLHRYHILDLCTQVKVQPTLCWYLGGGPCASTQTDLIPNETLGSDTAVKAHVCVRTHMQTHTQYHESVDRGEIVVFLFVSSSLLQY